MLIKNTVYSAALISSILLMVGCASQPTVSTARKVVVPEYYTVQPGDSLSKIALRYNLNYLDIARLNNIDAMDKIYVSQSLRLKGSPSNAYPSVQTRAVAQPAAIARQNLAQQAQQQTLPNPQVPPVVGAATATTNSVATQDQMRWVAPTNAALVQKFDLTQDHKGLYFAGNLGDPVYAAANGEVVYADDGLKEYGQLILIRHSNGYISAYAHNSKLLVKVGDKVQAGQKIAEMGSSGSNRVWLQFQIRLDGKPIDPATLLPNIANS
jgi:lipoprotein NlpD